MERAYKQLFVITFVTCEAKEERECKLLMMEGAANSNCCSASELMRCSLRPTRPIHMLLLNSIK